jgi:hypothetical protein
MSEDEEMIGGLFAPTITRPARIHAGMVFRFGGRMLRVHRVYDGDDAATPVIVDELSDGPRWLGGQYGLWSAGDIMRALNR